jgi:Zn-dependent metalloprotease
MPDYHAFHFIPPQALERLARDRSLPAHLRRAFAEAIRVDTQLRRVRREHARLSRLNRELPSALIAPEMPAIEVYRCGHGTTLPGAPLAHPDRSRDEAVRDAFERTVQVARFYRQLFGRNSVDGAGKTLLSSVHFSVGYANAFWNGAQMVYGDGDGEVFTGFTRADDVIAHELTHGVTQYSAGLGYANQAGGLNESLSDVFGVMFRHWRQQQDVEVADWRIGPGILGPAATSRGYACLRDLADPGATHCLTPQPAHFSRYHDGMDPHDSSGIANHAFYLAARSIGGYSWETPGRIWYQAMTAYPASPGLRMGAFANRTRKAARMLRPDEPLVARAVDESWKAVGL